MVRPAGYDEVRTALRDQYALLVEAFARLDPAGPTDCAGWSVEDLETHVAITARGLTRIAGQGADGPATGGVAAWADRLPEFAPVADEGAKAERLKLRDYIDAVDQALEANPEDSLVTQITGTHTLRDAAVFRLVEAVVHGLDAQLEPDPRALKIVVRELARAFAEKHPGHAVELRVPPYTAVQCLAGPKHTRGTPPNVVEAQPVAWLRLAAGREQWADLVRSGRVTASGERSDLSALLPLLG